MTDQTIGEKFQELATRFELAFPERLATPRTVGREAEYPIVDAHGAAIDLSELWLHLLQDGSWHPKFDAVNRDLIVGLEGMDYSFAWEVGRSTIEINSRPCAHLLELQEIHKCALNQLLTHTEQFGWYVLGYGVQPLTQPSLALMTPKQRYGALLEAMGDEWLWYTVTAADQLHVDVARPEMVRLLNFGLLMAPIIVALCGNSPVYNGEMSSFCSAREGIVIQRSRYTNRHGMPDRPYKDLLDFVTRISQYDYLLRRQDHHLLPDHRLFVDVLRTEGVDFEAFLLHDHYIWHSARLRVAHATLELRPACQQPPGEQMAAAALYLGLIQAIDGIETFLDDALGAQMWERMHHYHRAAIRDGLATAEPVPDLMQTLLGLVEAALTRRGYGEESLLAPLWQRLERRQNPAQQVRRVFTQSGIPGLINWARLEPGD
jgi:gamma-glutamylcysteine synthetase